MALGATHQHDFWEILATTQSLKQMKAGQRQLVFSSSVSSESSPRAESQVDPVVL